jgi:hypothetical protein
MDGVPYVTVGADGQIFFSRVKIVAVRQVGKSASTITGIPSGKTRKLPRIDTARGDG